MASNLLGRSLSFLVFLVLFTYMLQRVFSDDCGGTFTSDTGIFTSPNYPNGYNKSGECVYIIMVNEGDKVCLTFSNMSLDKSQPCYYDPEYVEARDGGDKNATLIYRICDPELTVHVQSTQNVMFVRFVSDGKNAISGFRATWDVCFLPMAYNGTLNKSRSGLDCLRWDEQDPDRTIEYLPEKNLTAAENYCRDPNNAGFLWCYTITSYGRIVNDICDINPCGSNPCQNDAGCDSFNSMYACIYQPGWTGKNCDVDINDCDPNPCKNDAFCIDWINEYRCWCQPEWTGKDCNISSSAALSTTSASSRALLIRRNLWTVILLFVECEIIKILMK